MALIRLKTSQIAGIRSAIQTKRQGNKCPLCERTFGTKVVACLDHDHVTGLVRGVFCKNCNGIEGKIKNLVTRGRGYLPAKQFLDNLAKYWDFYSVDRTGLLHPIHKDEEQKRVARNAKARKKRAATKKGK